MESKKNREQTEGPVLVFKDAYGIADAILQELRYSGVKTLEVANGRCFEKNGEGKYTVGATEEDYRSLVEAVKALKPSQIIHLMSISGGREARTDDEMKERLSKGLYSLQYLVKALGVGSFNETIDLVLISDNVCEVTKGEKRIHPENNAFFEYGKIMGTENPNLRCRCIDVDEATDIDCILQELQTGDEACRVAYRGGQRYVDESGAGNATDAESEETGENSVNTPGKTILKTVLQREISSYLTYSLPLFVILAHENLLPWYNQHFIQISAQVGLNKGYVMLDYVEPVLAYWDIVEMTKLTYEEINAKPDMLEYIREEIHAGTYVFVFVDEYYIDAKANYMNTHFVHEMLVYGYDDKSRKLFALGFGKENILIRFTVGYNMFIQAFESGKIHYKTSAPYAEHQAIELFRLKGTEEEHPFHREVFLRELGDYIYSRSNKGIISPMLPPGETWEESLGKMIYVYGLEIYDVVILKLQLLLQGNIGIDYRAIHLMAEHRDALYKKLEYVIKKYKLEGKAVELLNAYGEVCRQMQNVRIKCLEFASAANDRDSVQTAGRLLEESIEILAALKPKEKAILLELYKVLEQNSGVNTDGND